MSLSRPSSLLVLLLSAAPAAAELRLEVAGTVLGTTSAGLDVRLDLTNRGDAEVKDVAVSGELLGRPVSARLEGSLAPGAARSLTLACPLEDPTAGVHALTLRLDFAAAASGQSYSQAAYLLVGLGATPLAPVRLTVGEGRLGVVGVMRVGLESADGAAHRVRLRAALPQGMRAAGPDEEIEVPTRGRVEAPLRLFRVDVPWNSTQGIVVLAEAEEAGLNRVAAGTGTVRVGRDPTVMPRLRPYLLAVAIGLLIVALVAELRRRPA